MICPQFRPLTGGYERAAERLSAALAARGHSVTVITERRERVWPRREDFGSFRIRRWWCIYQRRLHIVTSLWSLALWLMWCGRSYQVWHAHQYGAHASLTVLLGRLLRRPVVLKLTNSGNQGLSEVLAAGRLPKLQRWLHRRVDACVALTSETREEALRFGIPAARVYEIGNGVDVNAFAPIPADERALLRTRLGLSARPMLVCVGRLAAEKNPLGLLKAWKMAQEGFAAGWTLVLVGAGPLREQIENRVRELEIEDSVILAGEAANVPDWLRSADAFVLASKNEGMSNTVLEALACGLPCVVTAVSGMQQLVGASGAGLIVPVGDPAALAQALVRIQADPEEREAMRRRGREIVASRYSMPVIVERYIDLYRGLVRPGASG